MILLVAASIESLLLVFLPRVAIYHGTLIRSDRAREEVAHVVDIRSALTYTIGLLIIAALCYRAAGPQPATIEELKNALAETNTALTRIRVDVDGIIENLTSPDAPPRTRQ